MKKHLLTIYLILAIVFLLAFAIYGSHEEGAPRGGDLHLDSYDGSPHVTEPSRGYQQEGK